MRFGCIRAFGFEWFYLYYFLYCTLLLLNFSWIVSASKCRLVEPNYLNLDVLCGYVIFILHFSIFLVILEFALVTTHNSADEY